MKRGKVKTASRAGLLLLLLAVIIQLARVYQVRYQVFSPLIPESIFWKLSEPFLRKALIFSIASLCSITLYFFRQYAAVILLILAVLVAGFFI